MQSAAETVKALLRSKDAIVVLDPEYKIVGANAALLEATNIEDEDQIVGKYLFDAFPENPQEGETGMNNVIQSLNKVKKSLTPERMEVQRYDIRREDGTYELRFWEPENLPILTAEGELAFIVHRVEDVTTTAKGFALARKIRRRIHRTYVYQNSFVALVAILFLTTSLSFWFDPASVGRTVPHELTAPWDFYWNSFYLLGSLMVFGGLITRRVGIEAAGHILFIPGLLLNMAVLIPLLGLHTSIMLLFVFALGTGLRAWGLIQGWTNDD